MGEKDANWWFGPNSLYAVAIGQTKWGKEGENGQDKSVGDWFKEQFKGTGVTIGVAPDTDFASTIQNNIPIILFGMYLLFRR